MNRERNFRTYTINDLTLCDLNNHLINSQYWCDPAIPYGSCFIKQMSGKKPHPTDVTMGSAARFPNNSELVVTTWDEGLEKLLKKLLI